MANIFSRIGDIISANVNDLLDKAEDPGKMVDQYLRKAKEDLAEVRKNTAVVIAEEKRCKRNVDEAEKEVAELTEYAKRAVAAGNDDHARKFLSKKQEVEARLGEAQRTYNMAKANADKMRQAHDKLVDDISKLEARKANIKATAAVAKTQASINEMTAGAVGASGALAAFDRMADKAQASLDAAMAEAELNAAPADDTESLKNMYAGGAASDIEDELAALKASMGGES